MEYTEQEFNALFDAVMVGASDIERNTPRLRAEIKFSVQLILEGRVAEPKRHGAYVLDLPAALRLMREAREQGAVEMRERAARFVANDWASSPNSQVIADEIRALPLKVPS